MDLEHRITSNVTVNMQARLGAIGFDIALGFQAIVVRESDPRWPNLKTVIESFDCGNYARSVFNSADFAKAAVLVMGSSWHHGYPEPSGDNGYREATFDLSDFCPSCGVGLNQIRPFRLSKSPGWGNKSMFQLNWMFDEYFVKPEVWKGVFEPFGIGFREVVLNRTGAVLDTVVQLDICESVDADMEGRPFELCTVCSRKKYEYVKIGLNPKPLSSFRGMSKSTQYVGSGASANRLVMVSQDLFARIKESGIKGIEFAPCAN